MLQSAHASVHLTCLVMPLLNTGTLRIAHVTARMTETVQLIHCQAEPRSLTTILAHANAFTQTPLKLQLNPHSISSHLMSVIGF